MSLFTSVKSPTYYLLKEPPSHAASGKPGKNRVKMLINFSKAENMATRRNPTFCVTQATDTWLEEQL